MKRKFLSNFILIFILNLVVKTYWMFGIDRKVQNIVGADEYGLYFSLLSLSILMNILLDVGITNFNNRSIAQDNSLIDKNLSRIIPLKFSLSVLYAGIVLGTGLILDYSSRQFHILWILIINQFFLSFILYLRSNISGLHLFRTDSFLSIIDRFFMILICGYLLLKIPHNEFRIEWFVYAQSLSYFLAFLIILCVVIKKTRRIRLRFPVRYAISILKQSYPYAILILLMSFFNRFDSVFLERMLEDGKSQAGIYAQSFRILDAANMYAVLIAGMLLPIFSKMLKLRESVSEMVRLSFSIVIIPALSLLIIAWFYNEEIIGLLYTDNIEFSAKVFRILIAGFVFISTSYIFGTLLTANGNLRQLNILALFTVIINISLNIILIPHYKAIGAAISAIISQGFYAISQVIISQNILNFKTDYRFIFRIVLFFGILFTGSMWIKNSIENWGQGFAFTILLALLLAWALRIITPGGVIKIMKQDQ